jgi:hypothetical protein
MKKLVSLLAKMSQDDRNLILFLAGRVSKKQGRVETEGNALRALLLRPLY